MHPTDKAARVAGAIYLLGVIAGPFSLVYVPNTMIVTGNAAATAANILAHETIFRLGILGDLLTGVWALAITFALYRLFMGVDQSLAAVMVILGGLMPAAIFFVNSLNWIAALMLANGTDLAAFTIAQQDALAMLFMHLHSKGNVVNSIFWGLWLFPFGMLVMRSGFLPRILGMWLIGGGFGYLAVSFAGLFAPQYQDTVFLISQPLLFSELAITFWLLVIGARVRPSAVPAA
jgi:Domain of unknown function (DUF4386)